MGLNKELKFKEVFCIATGAMISSGIFILPGIAFSYTGPSVFLSYLIAGILALLGVFSTIELATAMPKAGGDYYYTSRTLGPMVGTVSGFLSWFALSLKSAFAIFGIAEILYTLTGINVTLLAVIICLIFVILNIAGLKEAAKLEMILVFGLLILMVSYIVLGFGNINFDHFSDFTPKGINSIFITSGFIFVSFGGLLNISSVAEEIDNPKKTIPLAVISSVVIITIIYTLILIVTVGILPGKDLASSLTPIADTSKLFMGNFGYILISFAAMLAFITTALAGIMSASRYPMALSRDKLLPNSISKISDRFKTPIISVILTGVFIIVSLFFNIETLVKVASTVIITSYVLTNISVIILRESKIINYEPSFKSPLYPWIQLISIAIFTFFIVDLGLAAVEISILLLLLSLGVYFLYGKKRADKEYALLHLIERITDKELTSHDLESELMEILRDRDNIILDDFDALVNNATVIDIDENLEFDKFLEKVSSKLSEVLKIKKEVILNKIVEREKRNTTAISNFTAVPHIVLEDSKNFNLVIIRAKEGIRFSEDSQEIKSVFLFTGLKENSGFHLKILASIAYLVQEEGFEKKWLEAKNPEYLKNIVLMSRRKRHH